METSRENRLILIFIVLIFVVILLITFVLLGFNFYDDFLKLSQTLPQAIDRGSGGVL